MASVYSVAKYFLVLAASGEEDAGEAMTHLKLQKLLYYAKGFSLALHGDPLFGDTLEAWKQGPVVNGIWQAYKQQGGAPIPPPETFDASKMLTEQERELLNDVWNVYGQFSAWKLRDMTHAEPPWRNAYKQGQNAPILNSALKEYFLTQIED